MGSRVKSDFLIAEPSLLTGIARLLDLYGLFDSYNTSCSSLEADYKALLADWKVTGQDINDAIVQYELMFPPAGQEDCVSVER